MRWQEAARGIPVWAGAFFFEDETRRWPIRRMCTDVTEPPTYPKRSTWAAPAEYDSSRCYPDLTNPDTRAAYLRRLALALGAEPHHVDCGVTVGWIRGVLMVWAGIPDTGAEAGDIMWPFERAVNVAKSADKTTALALAWPADRKIHGG